ncbi:hypothetical protein P7L78_22130 [Tistrella bauzanensis]|uniref:hypothetical protein n=1 Tax=Tistrella TaxID=171436 RepID=UPI0031F6A827
MTPLDALQCYIEYGNPDGSDSGQVHYTACIGYGVHIAPGAVVERDVLIEADAWIGPDVHVMACARIGHDVVVEAGAVIAPCGPGFGSGLYIAAGAVVHAGEIVTADVGGDPSHPSPLILNGSRHQLVVGRHHVRAGCERHPPSVWRERGLEIIERDGVATDEAQRMQAVIIALIDLHGCVDAPDGAA